MTTSAIKPGQRFSDEQSTVVVSAAHGVRLMGAHQETMELFLGKGKVEAAQKEIGQSTTFKIEKTDAEI